MLFYVSWYISAKDRVMVANLFGNMTAEDEAKDAGENIQIIGRWSQLDGASGHCIAECSDASELYKWALNWSPICDLKITPVVDDTTARACVQTKPYFQAKESQS